MTATLDQVQLDYNCDTIATCRDGKRFLIGTYQLEEGAEQVRHGSISLFCAEESKLNKLATIPAPAGVLDVKFCKNQPLTDETELFAMALADGTIRLGHVTSANEIVIHTTSAPSTSPSASQTNLALSVSWNPCEKSGSNVAASFSSGILKEYSLTSDKNSLSLMGEHKIADLESWAVYHSGSVIFSGGDDAKLHQTVDGESRVLRRFNSGVTCIEGDSSSDCHLLVGTYEDKLYQFDLRSMRDPLQEVEIGGGVWRIKEHPEIREKLAIAAMYAGAFVIDRCTHKWEIKQSFKGHQSMCYGIDWLDKGTLVSCSFYDKLLAMWAFSG